MPGSHLRFDVTLDRFLEDLTKAAVQVAKDRRDRKSQASLQNRMMRKLKSVIQQEMQISKQCGSHIIGICCFNKHLTPWSPEALELDSPKK